MPQETQPVTNQMMVKTKDVNGKETFLTIKLADDNKEVAGFGQVVTPQMAKEMALSYFNSIKQAWKVIETIDTDTSGRYDELKGNDFNSLKNVLDPKNQTVSGVFGKEAILQILSQRNCEGIRYIIGTDNNLSTVILIGVEQDGEAQDNTTVQSKPVKPSAYFSLQPSQNDPIDVEVHKNSLTISQVEDLLSRKAELFPSPDKVIFGSF